jgi:hypothetical protein
MKLFPRSLGAIVGAAVVLAAAAALPARAATVDTPGGGRIITADLGHQTSVRAAAVAMLGRLHSTLGSRPDIVQASQSADDRSITIVFSASRNGQHYTGMTFVNAAPGSPADGAALVDTAARFSKTLPAMLRQLQRIETPVTAAIDRTPLAPAEALTTHPFPDGTGSMGVPTDWQIKGGGGGSAVAVGPTNREVVNFNFTQSALDPGGIMGQMLVNGTGIYPSGQLRDSALRTIVLLRYTGDPVDAWTKSWGQMANQAHRPGPTFAVQQAKRTGPHTAFVSGTGTYGDKSPFVYFAYLNVGPLSRTGQWGMYFTYVIVPTNEVSKEAATATAVLASIKINFGLLNGEIAASARSFDQLFQSQIANDQALDAARQDRTNASIARANANADMMQRQAVGMEHYVLDQSSIVNTETGAHGLVGTDVAAALVQGGSNYRILRPSELVHGVDY